MEMATLDQVKQKGRELLNEIGNERYLEILKKLESYFAKGKNWGNLVLQEVSDDYITGPVVATDEGTRLIREIGMTEKEFIICYRLSSITQTFVEYGIMQ